MIVKFPMQMLAPDGASGSAPDPAVTSPGSAPGATTPSPAPAAAPQPRVPFSVEDIGREPQQDDGAGASPAPAGAGAARNPQENPIPYSRVQQMIKRREAELMGQFRQVMEQVGQRIPKQPDLKQLARALGYEVPDDQPRFLTAEQVEEMVAERTGRLEAQFTQQQEIREANSELSRLKASHPDLFDEEGAFEALVVNTWGATDGSFTEAFNKVKAAIDRAHDRRVQTYAQGKRDGAGRQPLRPGGGATPTAPAGRKVHDLGTIEGQDEAVDALLAADGGI